MHAGAGARTTDAVEHEFGIFRDALELFRGATHDYLWWYINGPGYVATGKFRRFAYINNDPIHTTNVNEIQ